jgi:flagellar hook-associated protein 3 FlgL
MIRSVDSNSENFLNGLRSVAQRLERAQKQISTGLSFSTVSEDPDNVSTLLQVRADLSAATSRQSDLGRVSHEADAAEQAVSTAVTILERIRTLAAQGKGSTATPEARTTLGNEIGSLLERLGVLANTTFEGRYIFGGDSDQVPPYTIDLTSANPVSAYAGSAATREIADAGGSRFKVSKTAQEMFDSPIAGQNVFQSVTAMMQGLLANDQTKIDNAMGGLVTSLDHLNNELAFYGTVQNKLSFATNSASALVVKLKAQAGELSDADMTQAITDLQQAQIQQQAAFQARGLTPRKTLFDFLA